MVIGLSYVFAVIITGILACVLYPVAGVFWLVGLLGKVGQKLFEFSNHAIKSLWSDITNKRIVDVSKVQEVSSEVVNSDDKKTKSDHVDLNKQ